MTSFPCPLVSSSEVLVDDTDSRILYSSGWTLGGVPGSECEGTTHESDYTVNSTATFTFLGVGVKVFGTIGYQENSPTSIYNLDNSNSSQLTFPTNGQTNYRVPFYRSPLLNPGDHTLTIIVPPGDKNGRLYLDYIIYNPIPTSTSYATIVTTSVIRSASALSTPASTHSTSVNTIQVGVAGGLVGLAAGIALTLIVLRIIRMRSRGHLDTLQWKKQILRDTLPVSSVHTMDLNTPPQISPNDSSQMIQGCKGSINTPQT
ncbi:hypothetical protein F5050DRAFT_1679132 [Lentinula boryana]|uniref:Uncharacterized protein n=1 Tax=Lentinula boryana TaxID=40481 RepID=A0ABQ8Q2M7_9AGAR|nr:hypothetical protein F5050DRAFT_1679132 [Lentinula boryana]